jgi:gliding motility associated protien GldN
MKILKLTLIFCFAFTTLFAQKKKAPVKKKPVAKPVAAPAATPPAKVDSVHYWISKSDGLSVDPIKYTLTSLTTKINDGTVTSSTLVVKTGANQWKTAADYPELAPLIKAVAPKLVQQAYVPPALPIDSMQFKFTAKDGIQANQETKNRSFEPYASVRPQDVLYSKRLWRNVDFREKLNQPFSAKESNFVTLISDLIKSGKVIAFADDKFTTVLSIKDALSRFDAQQIDYNDTTNWEPDPQTGKREEPPADYKLPNGKWKIISDPIEKKIQGFQIKEDWIFDKIRQELEPRIVGIALQKTVKIDQGATNNANLAQVGAATSPSTGGSTNATKTANKSSVEEIFWINFEQVRPFLHEAIVINNYNDAYPLSFDDLLVKRTFASYIVKESNIKNIPISINFKDDQDRLRESERIKKALLDWEHDLWSY